MIVRLKVMSENFPDEQVDSFNSMIVRLKDLLGQLCQSEKLGFNSMIVRLKEIREEFTITGSREFQFYDSPIKSRERIHEDLENIGFNSMIVRLKDFVTDQRILIPKFQFYDSPIKSQYGEIPVFRTTFVSIL